MIVINDIEELYQENLEGKYFAACGFSPRCESGGDFNSGMLLFDMKRMREDITLDTYRILTQKMEKDFYLDQALLNEQFAKDGVKYVWKQKYNFTCPFYRKYKKQVHRTFCWSGDSTVADADGCERVKKIRSEKSVRGICCKRLSVG
mgnify:CR=1 FL=1